LLYQSISKGFLGTTMPAFEVALGGKPIWQVVAHLRSLILAKGSSQVKGDARPVRSYMPLTASAVMVLGALPPI
jgi:hypothetical protein